MKNGKQKQKSVILIHIHILAFKTFKMARELKNDESGLPFQILPESYLSQILKFPIAKLTLRRFGQKIERERLFCSNKAGTFSTSLVRVQICMYTYVCIFICVSYIVKATGRPGLIWNLCQNSVHTKLLCNEVSANYFDFSAKRMAEKFTPPSLPHYPTDLTLLNFR